MLAGQQNIGTGGALGIGEIAVFFHDQLPPQRDHEEHAQPSAQQRQKKDARVFEIEAEKDQRGQREDDSGGDGLAGVPGRLHNVVFKNRGPTQRAQHADRKNGDRNGGGNGKAGAQANIHRDRAKQNAEDASEKNGAESEFSARIFRFHIRLKFRGEAAWPAVVCGVESGSAD